MSLFAYIQAKKTLFIVGVALVLLVGFVTFFLAPITQEKTSPTQPTPTVFPRSSIQVDATQPQNGAIGAKITSPISVSFSKSLTSGEKDAIKIVASPSFEYTFLWDSGSKKITILPTTPLFTSQKYTISLSGPVFHSFTFTTVASSQLSEDERIEAQAQADKNFADWDEGIRNKYPWNSSLPLQDTNYFVYFDVEKEIFIGKLYVKKSSSSQQQDAENLKTQIQSRLQSLGVDITEYSFTWDTIAE